jgi:hypothetical protein
LQDIGEKNLLENPDPDKGPVLIPVKGVVITIKESKSKEDVTLQSKTGITDWPGKNNEKYPVKHWVKPIRMDLDVVSSKDAYDQPMLLLGINDPSKLNKDAAGWTIWPNFNDFRGKLMSLICDASSAFDNGAAYKFNDPKINKFKDQADLDDKIQKALAKMTLSKTDISKISEIYKKLTLSEMLPDKSHGDKSEAHWMMKTFDHAPSVAALASLTSMQSKILTARGDALAHLNAKIEGGKFTFTKVTPMVIVKGTPMGGAKDTIAVFMSAFDEQNMPDVSIEGGPSGAKVVKVEGGKAFIEYTAPSSGAAQFNGTISIEGREGTTTVPWSREIPVVQKSSSIAAPELQVLYAGDYPNVVKPSLAGGEVLSCSASGGGARVTGRGRETGTYIVKVRRPNESATVNISFRGRANGTESSEGPFPYKILPAPVPRVLTATGTRGGIPIEVGLDKSNPLRRKLSYTCVGGTVSYGTTQRRFTGQVIPASMLRQAPRGKNITVEARARNTASGQVLTMPTAAIKIE